MNLSSTPGPRRRSLLGAAGAAALAPTLIGLATPLAAYADSPSADDADALCELTASEAVAAIAAGRLSAVTYVRTLLDRAQDLANLHTYITLNRKGALTAAARVDSERRAGKPLRPLAGLPLLVKDNINTRRLRTTGGTPGLKGFMPDRDAAILGKLVEAGAIVLAKANMHELAFGITNTNFSSFAGFAQNPYDTDRVPGGSSGGTGAGIAARIAPAGLGTDTGGSVRVPAAFNGIVGLRPSVGNGGADRRYSTRGILPLSHTLDTPGPMGRTVADVALLDSAISGTTPLPQRSLDGVRLGIPSVLWSELQREVRDVMEAARGRLAEAGAQMVETDIPDLLSLSGEIIFPVALHEPINDIPDHLESTGATGVSLRSIADSIASPDVAKAFAAVMSDAEGERYPRAVEVHRPRLQTLLATYFREHDVHALLFPTVPVLPPKIDPVNGSSTFSYDGGPEVDTFTTVIRNMAPGAVAGMPGLTLPAGMSASGLPVGLSLEGPIGSDAELLAIGTEVEKVLGGIPAPPL